MRVRMVWRDNQVIVCYKCCWVWPSFSKVYERSMSMWNDVWCLCSRVSLECSKAIKSDGDWYIVILHHISWRLPKLQGKIVTWGWG